MMTIGQVIDKVNTILDCFESGYQVVKLTSEIFSIKCETEYECKFLKNITFEDVRISTCSCYIEFKVES